MRVISEHDHTELHDFRNATVTELTLARVKPDFDGLVASEKMELVKYVAKKVGVEIVMPDFSAEPESRLPRPVQEEGS